MKYAVFTESKMDVVNELSISNKIIEKESFIKIASIIMKWMHDDLKLKGYALKNTAVTAPRLEDLAIYKLSSYISGNGNDDYRLNIYRTDSNVRVRIVKYVIDYKIKRVQ